MQTQEQVLRAKTFLFFMWPPALFGLPATASREVNKTPKREESLIYFSTLSLSLLQAEPTDQNLRVWNLGRPQEVEAQVPAPTNNDHSRLW